MGNVKILHGHTYKLQVEISGDLYESRCKKKQWSLIFSDLKSIVKKSYFRSDGSRLYL
ncbi:6-pyruvoyl-tetrahydropterin synthase [Haemophilus influenzae]|uniref:6-carboxy-5,6,7,8-tetrahydropterin synthase n=1 Tax=Haemophilus influenzae TaxID=727 RepID=A0A2X1PRP0_HAEIF|nr:6-pyruvoyl-tetrahydropterin synthase [Haemophilus influenzae]